MCSLLFKERGQCDDERADPIFSGRVAIEEFTDIVPGWIEAIREHNQLIFNDPEFDAFINPVRDREVIARRKTIINE